jgi:hypothetical protein
MLVVPKYCYIFGSVFSTFNKIKIVFQKFVESKTLKLCAEHPATMSYSGGHLVGVTCKGGMLVGKYVLLQNTISQASLSLSEIAVYGFEYNKL